jgi:hypothetical protein
MGGAKPNPSGTFRSSLGQAYRPVRQVPFLPHGGDKIEELSGLPQTSAEVGVPLRLRSLNKLRFPLIVAAAAGFLFSHTLTLFALPWSRGRVLHRSGVRLSLGFHTLIFTLFALPWSRGFQQGGGLALRGDFRLK